MTRFLPSLKCLLEHLHRSVVSSRQKHTARPNLLRTPPPRTSFLVEQENNTQAPHKKEEEKVPSFMEVFPPVRRGHLKENGWVGKGKSKK